MAVKRPPRGTRFENKVRGSLKRIGFDDVAGGPDFIIGGFQVDAVGGRDDVLLVVEATQTTQEKAAIRSRIVELRGKSSSLRKGFRESDVYRRYNRFEFALVTQGYSFSRSERTLAKEQPRIHLLDYQILEYYQKLSRIIGPLPSLFNFLGELEVQQHEQAVHTTPAFRVKLPNNLFGYLFFCEPQKLLEVAYVARRESGHEAYYQRMLSSERLTRIRNFINKQGGIFPNNIILAFDDRPQFRSHQMPNQNNPSWLEWGVITFPKSYRAAWIIDGQHRLYAFGGDQGASKSHKLPVFAFERMSSSKQAGFFIEINKEQKPVSPDLIWDIESDLRPETDRGRIALTAKRLNRKGALQGRIYYPLSGEAARGKIKISSICNDINSLQLLKDSTPNMLQNQLSPLTRGVSLQNRVQRVANGINEFLTAILDEPEGKSYQEDIVLRPGGITLILTVYEQVLIQFNAPPRKSDLKDYATAFGTALDQVVGGPAAAKSFVKNNLTSYAQRREISSQILKSMRNLLNDMNFAQSIKHDSPLQQRAANVERKLAEKIATTLGITTMKDLKQRAPEHVWKTVQNRSKNKGGRPLHTQLSLDSIRAIIVRKDNRPLIVDKFTNDDSELRSEDAFMVAFDEFKKLRDAVEHGNPVTNPKLGPMYLSIFESILGIS